VNTDDNLFLEFSAPESMGVGRVMGENVAALGRSRESLLPYLRPASGEAELAAQRSRWERNLEAARLYDPAHALFLLGQMGTARFRDLDAALEGRFPAYAPFRFLRKEIEGARAGTPRLADAVRFQVGTPGGPRVLQVSAVTMRIGDTRAAVVFVDNDRRDIYGQRYFDGRADELDAVIRKFASEALGSLREAYEQVAAESRRRGEPLPAEALTVQRLKERVASTVAERVP
jgi:spermidine synthase